MQGGYPPGAQYPGAPPEPPGYGPPGRPGGFGPPGMAPPGPHGPTPGFANPAAPFGLHPVLQIPYSDKSKIVAGILQILVGFGVGRYYTGHLGLAIGQTAAVVVGVFLLSWLTCGLSALVVLWTVIDGIILLATDSTDANGRLLR
jgi:TM2 domain-containing membrane protein YozV